MGRQVGKRYYNPEFLLVTYKPKDGLLSESSLKNLKEMTDDFLKLEKIESVTSILNVPLLQSPVQEISELVNNVRTLENSEVDKNLVKKEFLNSEIYKNALVSEDFSTTSVILNLKPDTK